MITPGRRGAVKVLIIGLPILVMLTFNGVSHFIGNGL